MRHICHINCHLLDHLLFQLKSFLTDTENMEEYKVFGGLGGVQVCNTNRGATEQLPEG